MSEDRDQNNPLDAMFPSGENPNYERLKNEYEDRIQGSAEQGVLSDPAFSALGERMQRVRKTNPAPNNPQPLGGQNTGRQENSGIKIDPEQGRVSYNPVEPRLPEDNGQNYNKPENKLPASRPPVNTVTSGAKAVLTKLRQDFGIENIPRVDVKLGDSTFTLRLLDTGSVATAIRFADSLSLAERENLLNLQLACVSFSVQAIDGVPLWKIFDVPIPEDQKIKVEGRETHQFDPMNPPGHVKIQAAASFMDFLSSEAAPALYESLWESYGKEVDPKGSLADIVKRLAGDEEENVEDVPLP